MTQNNQMFRAEQIPEGYKKSGAGVIPASWKYTTIKSVTISHKQGYYSTESYSNSGIKLARITDLKNPEIDFESMPLLPISEKDYNFYKINVGDILLARSGAIGRYGIVRNAEVAVFASYIIRFSLDNSQIDNDYFGYVYQSETVQKQLLTITQGSSNININAGNIKSLEVLLPELNEQKKIATALSDTDALISELEKLIEKKQAIKTATMQQLLTGKTRLPEFALREDGTSKGYKDSELGQIPEDWELKSYGEIFKFLSTSNNSRDDLGDDGEYSYIHYGDIHTKFDEYVDFSKAIFPMIAKEKVSSAFMQSGDLVMADASEDYAGIGKSIEVGNIAQKVVAGLHTFLLRDINKTYVNGFRAYLHLIPKVKKSMDRLATGMKVYSLSKSTLLTILLPVPPKQEQEKIVIFLQDIDIDLAESKVKLEKLKLIKQGMMQELLTGKTRLV